MRNEKLFNVIEYEVGLNTKTHKGTIMLSLEDKAWALLVDLPTQEFNQVLRLLNNGTALYSDSGKIVQKRNVKNVH